jgi:SAM-dependent methyltransferase
MEIIELITELINYLKEYKIDPKYTFYKDAYNKLIELKGEIITKNEKHEKHENHRIQQKTYLLEPLRIYLLSDKNKDYRIFLSDKKYIGCVYVKYTLTKEELNNFITLIKLSEEYKSNILKLKDIDLTNSTNLFNMINMSNLNKIYLNICKESEMIKIEDNKIYNIKNLYDSLSFLLGIESIKILKYQRLDRIKEFLNNSDGLKVFNLLQEYNDYLHTLNYQERDNYIVHSGSVLEAIGTTYTRDVDVIVNKSNSDSNNVRNFIETMDKKYKEIDINVIDKNGEYHTKDLKEPLKYKKNWFTYQLPAMDGATDIYDVIINPVFNFTFAGMKFFNLNLTIYRFLNRASSSSMTYMIMLCDINKMEIKDKICLPNMTIRQGKIVIFYGEYLEIYFKRVRDKLKEYYNKDYTIDELKKIIKHCNKEGFDIYKGEQVKDPDTNLIKYFHIMIKENILGKYANNCNYLLDIGSGKLTDMRIWDRLNIKNVVGIEPSIDSIEMGNAKIKKFGFRGKIDVINGVGDDDWQSIEKYNIALKNKYDVVTFQFTLHYMMNNIDTVIKNINKVIKSKTKIIVTCMDGNKIQEEFRKYKQIEVRNKQEPIFAIIPFYKVTENIPEKDNNILVYFKGAYGVSSGSLEPIIDINKLIKMFEDNGIKLLERRNFADYTIPIKNKLYPNQLRVSSYYMSMIFEKI